MPEEIQGVKFSEFPSATPDNADEVVGLHSGDNARFSVANFILAVRQGLSNLFVPLTRKVNNKALSSDITLDASDVGAVDASDVGVADGVARLDSNGKVPSAQLPTIPDSADDISYDNTSSGLTATNVQDAIDEVQDEIDNLPAPPSPSDATPQALGTAAAGSSSDYSRADHVHEKPTYSASDVGLGNVDNVQQYSASNPPPYPVTSVNGNTGAVTVSVPSPSDATPQDLGTAAAGSSANYSRADHVHKKPTASDIGAYVKPSGGIPASDLASGVIPTVPSISTSTPNMDGTGAAGSTGDVSDAGHTHPTDTSRVPVYGLGKNLLDNAYFLNPVNQRGQSIYSTAADYCIDRWALQSGSISLTASGVKINASSRIAQSIENGRTVLDGKKITFSALVANVTGRIRLRIAYGLNPKSNEIGLVVGEWKSEAGIIQLTTTLPTLAPGRNYNFILDVDDASEATWIFPKIELGSEQTLAHRENGVWVLNEIPDYGEELRKCQRYFVRFAKQYGTYVRFGVANAFSQTIAMAEIPLPVTMRTPTATPSVSFSNIMLMNGQTNYPVTAVTFQGLINNMLYIDITVASGLTAGAMYLVKGDYYSGGTKSDGYLDISCEP